MIAPFGRAAKPFAHAIAAVLVSIFVLFPALGQAEPNTDWATATLEEWLEQGHESSPEKREKVVAAANVMRERALKDDVAAQVLLARTYETGLPRPGTSAQGYPHRALGWYLKAALAGDGFARARIKTLMGELPYFVEMATPTEPPAQSAKRTDQAADQAVSLSDGDDSTDRVE